jgi:SAM-dependent MidA family methyltransferase
MELGPGRGLFARDILDWSENKFPDFYRALQYVLVENSAPLRQRIEATLARHFASGQAGFASLEEGRIAPAAERRNTAHGAIRGAEGEGGAPGAAGRKEPLSIEDLMRAAPTILFANEFFDAQPVEILSPHGSLRVDARDGRFVETWVSASHQELAFLDRHSVHPEPGERTEVQLVAQQLMEGIAAAVQRGFIVVIDYGYTREEQLAGRHRGTLKAIRQHSVSANPYEAPGEQDITADVNLTALTAAAKQHDMQTQKPLTQSQFLMGIGEANQFADAFEECRLPQERAKVALQLKHLVTPAGMGESFQVLIASKGIEKERVAALAGLNFGRTQIMR